MSSLINTPAKMDATASNRNNADDFRSPKNRRRKDSKWEILTSLDPGTTYSIKPKKLEGYLAKRRKWPLKGWHKRYFVLENGILTYGKTPTEVRRGRTICSIDVGRSVISAKTELFRIDIDDEEYIHHIKAGDMETFALWLEQLQQHRYYQQQQLNACGTLDEVSSPNKLPKGFVLSPRNSLPRGGSQGMGYGGSNRSLVQEFSQLDDRMTQQLLALQQQAINVGLLAQRLEDEQNNWLTQQGSMTSSGNKPKHFFGLRKKKSLSASTSGGTMSVSAASRSSTLTSVSSSQMDPVKIVEPGDPELPSIGTNSTTLSGLSSSNPSLSSASGSLSSRPNSMPVTDTNKTIPAKLPSPGAHPSSLVMEYSPSVSSCCDELITAAQDLQSDVSSLVRSYSADRDRFKNVLQDTQEFMAYMMGHNGTMTGRSATVAGTGTFGPLPGTNTIGLGTLGPSGPQSILLANLRQALTHAMQQNSLLRSKLQKIHADSDINDLPIISSGPVETLPRGMNQSLSYSSSCMSTSQFFDAREYNTDAEGSDITSEEEEEEEMEDAEERTSTGSSEDAEAYQEVSDTARPSNDEPLKGHTAVEVITEAGAGTFLGQSAWNTGRRVKLPAMEADTSGVNLWNLLCRNIGKDLSKISMPVTLNEPLSVLQRLCEELEYSELLDKAVETPSRTERMVMVTAFVVSAYASCNARAAHKPFNPLLGETYECVREDRGFRYVSEQVSHHPPISACHAVAKNWTWWQEFRVKTKFWGKSMEFQPDGFVFLELRLPDGSKEVYRWNKITTCIHNLFSMSDRWADLYGECVIDCSVTSPEGQFIENAMTCKLSFLKSASGYWSNGKRHEVQGTILDKSGKALQSLFGKCTEALYSGKAQSSRCVWRPGALPDDHALYYGFSRFAIELNEILESERDFLPNTDTRFRPDQRYLEEGLIPEAESTKLRLEQAQRERRAEMAENSEQHQPVWFEKTGSNESQQQWVFKNTYWDHRTNPRFSNMNLPQLW